MRVFPSRFTLVGLLALSLGAVLAPGCGDGEVDDGDDDAGSGGRGGSGGQSGEGGMSGAGPATDFPIDAVAAQVAATVALSEAIAGVAEFGGVVIGFHADNGGASILDLSDAQNPQVVAPLASTGVAIGAAYDAVRRVLYLLSGSGDLRAWQVADPTHPVQVARLTLEDSSVTAIARISDRLYVLGQRGITPVGTNFTSAGTMSGLAQESTVPVEGSVGQFATGGGQLYLAKAGGEVEVWSAPGDGSPRAVSSFKVEGDVVGLVARGTQVLTAVRNAGLRVLDFADHDNPSIVYSADAVADVVALRRSGNLIVLGLERDLTLALDVSTLSVPRALVSRKGALPQWMAASNGNVVLGSGKSLSVLGVPPFVSSSVPAALRASFPHHGRIPLQLSKGVDPKSVSSETVTLRCAGETVPTTLALGPDSARLTLLPSQMLPAEADCSVGFDGVKDTLGLAVSSPGSLGLKTAKAGIGSVESPKSSYPHEADGAFTGWRPGLTGKNYEYGDVTPAQGVYSKFYADHDGARLWILNDWFYNGDAIEPDCYNQFELYTGNGSELWSVRAYGDQRVEVRKNGQLLAADDDVVTGGYARTATPNDAKPHTVYEIGVETAPGSWSVQLSGPGPTFACTELETDPTTYAGASSPDTTSVDPTRQPAPPATPSLEGGDGTLDTLTPTLSWSSADDAGNFTQYLLEVTRGQAFGSALFKQWVYGQSFTLPPGLVMFDTTYTWRVTGYNLAGTAASEPASFSVPSAMDVGAPNLTDVQPASVPQNTAATLTITGSGFIEGAQVFFGEVGVATMFENETSLQATLSAEDTAVPGEHNVSVRNAPDDPDTASQIIGIIVTPEPVTECAHSECAVGERLDDSCSPCALDVCTGDFTYCCEESWDAACVQRASVLETCTCGDMGSGGQSGGGRGGSAGATGAGATAGRVGAGGSGGIGSAGEVGVGGTGGGGGGGGGAGGAGGTAGGGGAGPLGGTGGATAGSAGSATAGTAGSGGAPCSDSCWESYPLGSGPPVCVDESQPLWDALNECACGASCIEECPNACEGTATASTDGSCFDCIYMNCNPEYLACTNDAPIDS
jgi:hypothetical protein